MQGFEMTHCKRNHKWRVGSKNGELIKGKVVAISLNVWCEDCNKKIRVSLYPYYKLKEMRKK